jgi:hypothetical protein
MSPDTNADPKSRPWGWRAWTVALSLLLLGTLTFKYLSSTRDLTDAIIKNDVSKARWALRFGADVEHLQQWGWSGTELSDSRLTLAARKGNPEMLALLTEWGADVNRADGSGSTPLVEVQHSGNLQAVKLLIASGAKLSPPDTGSPELSMAISCDHPELVRYLLDQGVSVTAPPPSGWPPVYLAAMLGKPDMVQLLLDRGAPPVGQSRHGREISAREAAEHEISSRRRHHEESKKTEPSPFQAKAPVVTDDDLEKAVQPWKKIIEMIDAHNEQAK